MGPREATDTWSYPDYADLRDAKTGMKLWLDVHGKGELDKDSVRAMFVSTNYFQSLGVTLTRGPGFSATAEPAVILGHRYWQNHFASDPDIIGKTVTLDEVPHIVTGVAANEFDGHVTGNGTVAVFLPLERHPLFQTTGTDRGREWLLIHGRLKPRVSVAQASAAVSTVTSSLATQYPSTNENKSGIAAPYHAYGNLVKSRLAVIQALRADADRNDLAGGLPEYLRHDAGAQRDARAENCPSARRSARRAS